MTPSENGPHCIYIPGGIMTVGGDTMSLTAFGKTYRFEWHRFCGPMFCTKTGKETKAPAQRNKWWAAFDLWCRQGQRTKDGVCLWDAPAICESCKGKGNHPIDKRNAMVCRECSGEGGHYPVPTKPKKFESPASVLDLAQADAMRAELAKGE